MRFKTYILVLLAWTTAAMADDSRLKIFVPRDVAVNSDIIKLGDVAVLTGNKQLIDIASNLPIGRLSIGAGDIQIDRNAILSRLASAGVYASQIEFAGAQTASVKRNCLKITSEHILTAALKTIADNGLNANCSWKPATTPKDMLVDAEANEISIKCSIANSTTTSLSLKVLVLKGEKELAAEGVQFHAQYAVKKAVAIKDITAGSAISPDNTKIETYNSSYPQTNWSEPFGLIAKRLIRAKTIVSGEMTTSLKDQIIITRNQGVVIQIKRPGLTITAMGEAMQNGKASDYIKVKNIDSQKVLVAKVNSDGTVEPVY